MSATAIALEVGRKKHIAALNEGAKADHLTVETDPAAEQLMGIYFKLGAYGQRVLLAQAAAMLRVQSGK